MKRRVLSDLFTIRHPHDYLREVLQCFGFDARSQEALVIVKAFKLACHLYQGRCSGFRECDTAYHDFAHAAETFLAMGRLLHGASLDSAPITPHDIAVGLTAAILHDAGYIRKEDEQAAHGALLKPEHETGSAAFVAQHGEVLGLGKEDVGNCDVFIRGTIMAQDVNAMSFASHSQELLTRMLSVSDLLAQLSSSIYLERLKLLYEEDRHTPTPRYRDLVDCYRQACPFDKHARSRIRSHLEQSEVYLTRHFTARWNTPANLYRISADRQIHCLQKVLEQGDFDPALHLRRWGGLKAFQRMMLINFDDSPLPVQIK